MKKDFITHHSYFFVHEDVPAGDAGALGAGCDAGALGAGCGAVSGVFSGVVISGVAFSGGVGGIGPSMRKVSVLLTTVPCQAAGPAAAGRL